MYEKILVGIDGSSDSDRAISHASELSKKFDGKLTLLTVEIPHSQYMAIEGYVLPDDPNDFEENTSVIMAKALKLARSFGAVAYTMKSTGNPSKEIMRIAREDNFDLIVLGSRGLGKAKSFFLGSVSKEVIQQSSCPVLVVRPRPLLVTRPLLGGRPLFGGIA